MIFENAEHAAISGNLSISSFISNLSSIWKNAFVAFAGISHYLEVLHFCAMKNELLWYQSEQAFWIVCCSLVIRMFVGKDT